MFVSSSRIQTARGWKALGDLSKNSEISSWRDGYQQELPFDGFHEEIASGHCLKLVFSNSRVVLLDGDQLVLSRTEISPGCYGLIQIWYDDAAKSALLLHQFARGFDGNEPWLEVMMKSPRVIKAQIHRVFFQEREAVQSSRKISSELGLNLFSMKELREGISPAFLKQSGGVTRCDYRGQEAVDLFLIPKSRLNKSQELIQLTSFQKDKTQSKFVFLRGLAKDIELHPSSKGTAVARETLTHTHMDFGLLKEWRFFPAHRLVYGNNLYEIRKIGELGRNHRLLSFSRNSLRELSIRSGELVSSEEALVSVKSRQFILANVEELLVPILPD